MIGSPGDETANASPADRVIRIDHLDDPRVEAYRNLKDRDLASRGDRFIVEGEVVVQRLLASDYPAESVLLSNRREAEIAPLVQAGIPVYIAPDSVMEQVLGFKFHSGVIACGKRKPAPSLQQFAERIGQQGTILVCPEIANTENLGVLVRIAAAFGVDGFVLGERCCDPFYRQAIRVSMGTVFSINLLQSHDLMHDLKRLRDDFAVELAATVLDPQAEPLHQAHRNGRLGLLLGNEAQGLSPDQIDICSRKITIPMSMGTDSLNVAIAAAVCLYHFRFTSTAG